VAYSSIDLSTTPPHVDLPRDYNLTLDLLDRHLALGHGDRVAVIDDDGRHTYRELAERVARAAAVLAGLGVVAEQRVALCLLDTLLTTDDYRYLLRDSRAHVLIVSDHLVDKLAPAIADAPALRATVVAPTCLGGDTHGLPSWRALLDQAAPHPTIAATTPDDVAFWLYSSGSTGRPKGAMHLHGSPIQTAALYARPILGLTADDVIFSAAKLFFAYGLGNSLSFPFAVGATAVLMAERPTPAAVTRTLARHQPTIFCGVPTLFAQLLADPGVGPATTSAALRLATSAGEALPRHVSERWRARFGTDILDGIGSTEMLHIFLSNRPGDVHDGTTGRPVPGYELDLRSDGGGPTSDGEEGALWVRGPTACTGYWNDRARSLATFHGPWTRTGDRYVRNADGTWTYGGRADDMLKVGGIWVSPFEVESALSAHPLVLEAAVVGHEDADGLTKPKGFVVLKDRAAATAGLSDELKAFVKAHLAPFKYPRWIEFVDELPKTATGKIQRYKLRG
jgi:benzoate-CoA ligase family protein